MAVMSGTFATQEKAGAATIVSQAIRSMATVASFGAQDRMFERFAEGRLKGAADSRRLAAYAGVCYGLSQLVQYCCYALLFWFGGWRVGSHGLSFHDMMIALMVLIFACFGLGAAYEACPTARRPSARP